MPSGIPGHCSGHPIRTRFVLADGAGTDLALFLGSVEPLARLVAADIPSWSAGMAAIRGACRNRSPLVVACGGRLPAVARIGRLAARSRIGQPGGWLMPLRRAIPVV